MCQLIVLPEYPLEILLREIKKKIAHDVMKQELYFGQIVNWFDPTPVLSAMMLQGGFGDFSFYFRSRDEQRRTDEIKSTGTKNNEFLLPGKMVA
jgi:hypothetical protein